MFNHSNRLTPDIFNSLSQRPDAPQFGIGKCTINNVTYVSDGTQWTIALPTPNIDGDLVANIVPRTDTLANLLQIVGSQGELASATDVPAIVQFNGSSAPGIIYYPVQSQYGSLNGAYANMVGAGPSASYGQQIDFVSLSSEYASFPLMGFYNSSSGVLQLSLDAVNYFNVDGLGFAANYCAVPGRLVGLSTGSTTTAYYSAAPYSTWTAYPDIASVAATFSAPIMCGIQSAVIVASGTNQSALIALSSSSVYQLSLPTVDAWEKPSAPQYYARTNAVLALTYVKSTNKVSVLQGAAMASAAWTAMTLPGTLGTTIKVAFTKNTVLIADITHGVIYTATYSLVANTFSAWTATSIAITAMVANNELFFIVVGGVLQSSPDGISWTTMPSTGANASQLASVLGGVIVYDASANSAYINNLSKVNFIRPFAIGSTSTLKNALDRVINRTANTILSFSGFPQLLYLTKDSSATGTINMLVNTTNINISCAAQSTLTVNLPPNVVAGTVVAMRFANAITTLTVGTQAAPANQTINGASTLVTTAAQFQVLRFTLGASLDWWVG